MRKTKHKIPNTNRGITLISLIITIIVMLILVAVTISMAINGGLFEKAGEAVSDTQNAIDSEQHLASGGITIGDRHYTIDDYVAEKTGNLWPITWNSLEVSGNTSITVDGQKFVKVSSYIPQKEEIEKGSVTVTYGEEILILKYYDGADFGNMQIVSFATDENEIIFIIATEKGRNGTFGIEITEMGIYAMDFGSMDMDIDFVLNSSNAVAILVEDGTFYFTRMDEEIGETYRNSPVITYYTGIENTVVPEWAIDGEYKKVKKIIVEQEISPISTAYWFINMSNCVSMDLRLLKTNKVTDMENMFSRCTSLESIIWGPGWDTSNVTNMSYIFYGCSSLKNLNLSGWNTSKVENMRSAFEECYSLTELNISSWNTQNVKDFVRMFTLCTALNNIILGDDWNTSAAENMSGLFSNCCKLFLDCSNWDVSNVKDYSDFNVAAPGVILPLAWQTVE